jgi:hypothetical protein
MPTYEIAVLSICAAPFVAIALFYGETRLERRVRSQRGSHRAQRRLHAPPRHDAATAGQGDAPGPPDASAEPEHQTA